MFFDVGFFSSLLAVLESRRSGRIFKFKLDVAELKIPREKIEKMGRRVGITTNEDVLVIWLSYRRGFLLVRV